jgi:hypothetical protein
MNDQKMNRPKAPESPFQRAAEAARAEAVSAAEAPQNAPPRAEMRPPMREEDPRARAARRAQELRDHRGSLDDGTDDFYVDPSAVPPGWDYEWKRKTVMGAEDPAYQVALMRAGWEPVPASRHPEMMPDRGHFATIERKGMILMERPKEITDEMRELELRKARQQVRQKEQQLNSAPEGQFGRDHAQVRPKINKSYEAIPIPEK